MEWVIIAFNKCLLPGDIVRLACWAWSIFSVSVSKLLSGALDSLLRDQETIPRRKCLRQENPAVAPNSKELRSRGPRSAPSRRQSPVSSFAVPARPVAEDANKEFGSHILVNIYPRQKSCRCPRAVAGSSTCQAGCPTRASRQAICPRSIQSAEHAKEQSP